MLLSLLLFLLIVGLVALLAKYIRLGTTLIIASLLLVLSIATGPMAAVMLEPLQSGLDPTASPGRPFTATIVLLGAGLDNAPDSTAPMAPFTAHGRISRTASLYRECAHRGGRCDVIVSGGATGTASTEADIYAAMLVKLGVPANDIVLEKASRNTWENAQFSSPLIRAAQHSDDRTFLAAAGRAGNPQHTTVMLVSSAWHLKRAMKYFSHFGITTQPMASDAFEAKWTVIPLAYNLALAEIAMQEYIGTLRYSVYQFLGWNPPAVGALTPA